MNIHFGQLHPLVVNILLIGDSMTAYSVSPTASVVQAVLQLQLSY